MSIKQPIYHEFDLNATSGNSRVISLTHTDDAHVDVIELCVKQQGAKVDITGATVVARMVLHSTADILLNDSVSCTINDAGNILIPFDNAAVQTRKGIVKIEVNITRDPDILTLQLPLWVKINGSILDSATVDPHSEGTIPELLEEVREELERVEGFATAEDVFEILDSTLEGNPSVAPTLLIDNTVDQQFNPDGHWIMYYIDSDDLRHNIFDFANLPSGTSDYTDLQNKPQINSVTLSGNKSSDNLGLQEKLTIQAPSGYDPKDYLFLRNNGVLGFNSQFVLSIQDSGFPKLSYWGSVNGVASITTSSIVSDGLTVGINGNIPVSEGGTYYRFCTNSKMRKEIYLTNSGKAYQKLTTLPGGTWVEGQWQEIGSGGSQIVSGVVNQNGTITFIDNDGNAFTTSGSKLVTSGDEQISMGYDNGGFYFLFDDGQEAS